MIKVDGLSKKFGSFQLGELSLGVAQGEYFVILGPCGCGKTMLLETIAGLHRPDTGRISIRGRDVTELVPEKRNIGFVYQELCLFPHLSVRQNIAYGLRFRGITGDDARKRVSEMIDLLDIRGIADRSSPEGLSGGESQKVALARSLAVQPDVLLLDEPHASLDYVARGQITSILQEINQQVGVTIIHVTHDYTEAAALGRRIAVMRDGKIVQIGAGDEIFWRPQRRFVAEFLGVANLLPATVISAGQVEVADVALNVATAGFSDAVLCTIRPEDVLITPDGTHGRDNALLADVVSIRDEGFTVRIELSTDGLTVQAAMPRARYRQLALSVGQNVGMVLSGDDLHILRGDE